MFEPKKKVCRYFMEGRCQFNTNCLYLHPVIECFLIRHAQSKFNHEVWAAPNGPFSNEAQIQFQFNSEFIDCGVTEEGLKEIEKMDVSPMETSKNCRDIDCIFVSPLQRALLTTTKILKDHSLHPKRVIVLGSLTEVLSKICDMMGPPESAYSRYPNFDFSFFKEEITGREESWQDELVSKHLRPEIDQTKKYGERYLDLLKKVFPEPLETSYECFGRTMGALRQIWDICIKEGFMRIAIVSHNRILKYMEGRACGGRVPGLRNCQIRHTTI